MAIATLKVGAMGIHKALGLAKAQNARFLLASTSEVYSSDFTEEHLFPKEHRTRKICMLRRLRKNSVGKPEFH